ncbi:MAG TPA: phenylalanine--tRNA ligase subunit beta [Caulobacteraceae bacterium]|jgi:phenylalanyl-tRNA synthetase beta chain
MKFTLSWLKEHLETSCSIDQIAEAMTMAGLEVEEVIDPSAKLRAFTVAKVVEAVQHPNADRLRVCQVDTVDGRKEIVCGAPNARPGLTTVYAPIGTYIPGTGITLEPRAVRGVVSNGMLCSAAELEVAEESDGILELPGDLAVGAPVAPALGAADPVIDFEVTPNRPDWLGVEGIARDLAAAGVGRRIDRTPEPVPGRFPCPIEILLPSPEACPVFAGRLIQGVRNGPSPEWLQARLRSIGLRPINALVDVTNLITHDRARPLHVYDATKLVGNVIVARLGRTPAEPSGDEPSPAPHHDEQLIALDGKTYDLGAEMCVIADAGGERPIGLGGVMGGMSTACSEETTDVFIESAWFDPIRTARTGRATGIASDAQYRFARGVDPESLVPGIELATRLILDLCGGEPSDVVLAGQAPERREPIAFDPAYVHRLAGLSIGREGALEILRNLGFEEQDHHGAEVLLRPPSWRRDVEGKADLVEEVARIAGYPAIPSTPLPDTPYRPGGVLTPQQARARAARRALAAWGWREAVTWSFTSKATAELFGGGKAELVLANPIAADLDCMRPSIVPNLLQAADRNAKRGFPDAALFEIGPVFLGDRPNDQRTAITAVLSSHPPRRWDGARPDPLFELKGDLMALLAELGAPTSSLRLVQGQASPWFHPGRSARVHLGPKTMLAEFGELHPRVLKVLDLDGPLYGFELTLDLLPAPKRKAAKTRPALALSPLMPLRRDFAFLLDAARPADDLARAVAGVDKALIAGVHVFDVYAGAGVPEGQKSVALEVTLQPRDHTLADAEIEALSARVVAAAEKAGARLRA